MIQNLLLSNESTDTTLIREYKTKFKAHKFILNACSPVAKSLEIKEISKVVDCDLSDSAKDQEYNENTHTDNGHLVESIVDTKNVVEDVEQIKTKSYRNDVCQFFCNICEKQFAYM